MAKNPITSIISAVAPIIILVVVALIVVKFQTDIGNFISKLTQSEEQKAEEKRVDENGVFDNIAEFFFGKSTEDKPATDDGVSKNDFDQNSATQNQRASKAQAFSDEQLIADIAEQTSSSPSSSGLSGESAGVQDTITATVIRGDSSPTVKRNRGKTITVNVGSKAKGSGSRIVATDQGLQTISSGGGSSGSSSSSNNGNSSKGSSVGISDRITATVIRGGSRRSARPKGNLSKQSQRLNTKTRGASRFNR